MEKPMVLVTDTDCDWTDRHRDLHDSPERHWLKKSRDIYIVESMIALGIY